MVRPTTSAASSMSATMRRTSVLESPPGMTPRPRAQHVDLDDAPLDAGGCASGAGARATGPVDHADVPLGAVAMRLPLGRDHRGLKPLRGPVQRPVVLIDAQSQPQPAGFGHRDIAGGT